MHSIERMIETHPAARQADQAGLAECIAACYECAQACTACADACLSEPNVAELLRCIRLNQDCFDVCVATGNILSRLSSHDAELNRAQLEACIAACRACGQECERHAGHMEHCRVCADSCHRCEEACNRMVGAAVH